MKSSIKNYYFENSKLNILQQAKGNFPLNTQQIKQTFQMICPSIERPIFQISNGSHLRINTHCLSSNKKIPISLSNHRKDSVNLNMQDDIRLVLMLDHTTGNSQKRNNNLKSIQQTLIK